MKALSIRQPWAWLIVNGYKDIENRSWNTKYRGLVLIHAAKGMTRHHYLLVRSICESMPLAHRVTLPRFKELERGGIVGYTHITDCVDNSPSPWFFGPKGFTLTGSKPLPFLPMKGRLSFFETGHRLICAGREKEALVEDFKINLLYPQLTAPKAGGES